MQETPPSRPEKLKPSVEKLDIEKLKRDISKYESAGVPPEKMGFWTRIDEMLARLETEAVVRDEIHPLDILLSKEQFTTEEDLGVQVPESITNALQKDKAPLSEVHLCTFYVYACMCT